MSNWLKVGYFTEAQEAGPGYWLGRDWVSDGPGRSSKRWRNGRKPRKGALYPRHGPRYDVGDFLVVYITERKVCTAILEVVGEPHWDPKWVDEHSKHGEGERWGVVTKVKGRRALALDDAPALEEIGVLRSSVQRKGHLHLEDWQFEAAQRLIGRVSPKPTQRRRGREIPIEKGEVEGYEVVTKEERRQACRREAALVEDFCAHLEAQGDVVKRNELLPSGGSHSLYSDLFNKSRRQLIEAKAGISRGDIRMAIGQLADYERFIPRLSGRAVLLGAKPQPDLLLLLRDQGIAAIWRNEAGFADNANGEFT
jgi:hypothetical protein